VTSGSNESQEKIADCSLKAMDLLARRPHFRRQLESKLLQRGFERDQVAIVCDRLEERRLLDDLECARTLANGSLRRKSYGPRRVQVELARRGASEEVVDQVVAEAFGGGEESLLKESAAKWLRGRVLDRQRLARHLERKGFSSGAILRFIGEFERGSEESAENDFS
jgi:regulatory protein